jgi:hypothetical protein
MPDPATAYDAARAAIARARAEGATKLSFDREEFRPLDRLPPEIAEFDGLRSLDLDNTRIHDLTPLAGLAGLQGLSLNQTAVQDLTPLAGLAGLQWLSLDQTAVQDLTPLAGLAGLRELFLDGTQVVDLRPIRDLSKLVGEGPFGGLRFRRTPAVARDAELRRLSEIADDTERTRETLAYLRTLPPWPEPLPWQPPAEMLPGAAPEAPEPEGAPRIVAGAEGLDLGDTRPTQADRADPIKERLYARLPEAVAALLRFGNRYVEVKAPAEALRDLVAVAFAEAELLEIHLELAALTDLRKLNEQRQENERLDADCLAALNAVLRLGPGVTLGHPDVDLYEERLTAFEGSRQPATVAEGERRVAAGLSGDPIASERLQRTAGALARAGDAGRVAAYRRSFHRNVVLALVYVAGGVGDAATGHVFGEVTVAAARFLVFHTDAIMATAPAWGQTGYAWLEYMLIRAHQIVREAQEER